jgi:dTDP-4-dehydrorhamnose 3,5-epimerase
MSLPVRELSIPGVKAIKTKKFEDSRGFFSETYNRNAYRDAGIDLAFVQDNHALSKAAGTVRGLHYQGHPFAQDKLVRVVSGRILDVVVDIRRSSPTFGQWLSVEISADEWNQILVPIGFAHGLCTLEPDTQVLYKVTNYYSAAHDFGIRWNDPDLNIRWPFSEGQIELSEKDKKQPLFKDVVHWF